MNDGDFMSIASFDGEPFQFYPIVTFNSNSASIDVRNMKLPPFDASRHGESNELLLILLRSLDAEIL